MGFRAGVPVLGCPRCDPPTGLGLNPGPPRPIPFQGRLFEKDTGRTYQSNSTNQERGPLYRAWTEVEEAAAIAEYGGPSETICIWCGQQCHSLEALEGHEEECAP